MGDEDPRRDRQQLRERVHLHAARAGGCGGTDHPVEFSSTSGFLEAWPRAGLRLHSRAEAGRTNSAYHLAIGGTGRRGGRPRRGAEHRDRRPGNRESDCGSSRHRQDCFHRIDCRGERNHARRG